MINKPRHPADLAADVVERVIATAGDPYLETKMHSLSWWQLSMLDVRLFLASAVAAIVAVLGCVLWLLVKLLVGAMRYAAHHRQQSHKSAHSKKN